MINGWERRVIVKKLICVPVVTGTSTFTDLGSTVRTFNQSVAAGRRFVSEAPGIIPFRLLVL
jgi:hypothetical protein